MAEIVNLNRTRKRLERERRDAQARENRARFGRTAAEKQRDVQAERALERTLDGSRLEDGEPPTGA